MFRLLSDAWRGGAPKLVAVALGAIVLGVGGGLAAAAAAGVSIPQLGINVPVPPEKSAALERLAAVGTTDSSTQPAPAPKQAAHPLPAQMLGSDVPVPVSPSLLHAQNGWLVSNGKTLVAVYAGAAGDDASAGRVVIVRQNLIAGRQTVRILDAGPTGALTIASAPLGRSVETSAQAGSIRLRGAGGRRLELDLRARRVSLVPYKAPLR